MNNTIKSELRKSIEGKRKTLSRDEIFRRGELLATNIDKLLDDIRRYNSFVGSGALNCDPSNPDNKLSGGNDRENKSGCGNPNETKSDLDKITVSIYLSKENEPNTDRIVQKLLAGNYDVYVPAGDDYKEQTFAKIDFDTCLAKNKYSVYTPVLESGEACCTEAHYVNARDLNVDLLIVPALACDKNFDRLGRGAGWYDKAIDAMGIPIVCALIYDEEYLDELPSEEHDKKVDYIITEKRIMRA